MPDNNKPITLQSILKQLELLGNKQVRAQSLRNGAGENQFGVRLGDIRKVAKQIKTNHELAFSLWKTNNVDARLLAILIMTPKSISFDEINKMIRSVQVVQVAEWFISYVIKKHPDKESLRMDWMNSKDPMSARAGWSLTAERVAKNPEGLDLPGLLDRIEAEMADVNPVVQWTMNVTLAEIGIHYSVHRERALNIGETLGVYRDYPVSKGCTSPFAPIWINEIVSRQEKKI